MARIDEDVGPLCAWCHEPVADPVLWHGVSFHRRCWDLRHGVLNPSPEALTDFVVDELR